MKLVKVYFVCCSHIVFIECYRNYAPLLGSDGDGAASSVWGLSRWVSSGQDLLLMKAFGDGSCQLWSNTFKASIKRWFTLKSDRMFQTIQQWTTTTPAASDKGAVAMTVTNVSDTCLVRLSHKVSNGWREREKERNMKSYNVLLLLPCNYTCVSDGQEWAKYSIRI